MTDKEIEALAREYAYHCFPPEDRWEDKMDGYERVIAEIVEYRTLPMLKWLSERFEIVSKEQVREEYTEIQERIKDNEKVFESGNSPDAEIAKMVLLLDRNKAEILKALFPQTLKTEENDSMRTNRRTLQISAGDGGSDG